MNHRVMSLLAGHRAGLLTFLLSLSLSQAGVEITKCCPRGQLLLTENQCSNRTEAQHEDLEIFGKFPPKIFSLDAGAYVTETFEVGGTWLPQCDEGERVERLESGEESDESFLILYEDRTLFLTRDTTSYPDYCLDSSDGVSTALVCTPHPALQCLHSVCVSSCCPDSMVFDPLAQDCVYSENYTLVPPFTHTTSPPSFRLLSGHPQCQVQVYSQEEFRLRDDGQLEIEHHHQHHIINTSQYCLQDTVPGQDSSGMVAKVCRPGSDQERARLDVISRKLTPALLIISEIFLLLTFVLHVIVPEFRKQMFGWMKMCTVAALFLGYQMLVIAILGGEELQQRYSTVCQAVGFSIQYFFLAAFCWMSSMSGEVWTTFRYLGGSNYRQITQTRRFYYFNLYSWGLPAIVSLITLIIHLCHHHPLAPGLGSHTCFFAGELQKLLYLHGIIAAILLINIAFFIATSYNLLFGVWAPSAEGESRRYEKTKQMLGVVVELFLVMGLTWVADVISTFINWRRGEVYYGWEIVVFDVINSLQGLLIFLVLVCKQKMREKIRLALVSQLQWCRRGKGEGENTDTTRVIYTVSPKTKTSHCVSQSHHASKTKISSWRHSSLLDSFTPAWKRGSYDLSHFHSQRNHEAERRENRKIKTVSCEENFGNESKC